MPTQNANNNEAISRIVLYYGPIDRNTVVRAGNVSVVLDRTYLPTLPNPQDKDIAVIENGEDNGTDIGVYHNGEWRIKKLRGSKGDQGNDGDAGGPGPKGDDGNDGSPGDKGDPGDPPEHEWQGSSIRFRNPDGSWGPYVQLKGPKGDAGRDGNDGRKGDDGNDGRDGDVGPMGPMPNHEWQGTSLRFEKPDGSYGPLVNLRGPKGADGAPGGGGGTTPGYNAVIVPTKADALALQRPATGFLKILVITDESKENLKNQTYELWSNGTRRYLATGPEEDGNESGIILSTGIAKALIVDTKADADNVAIPSDGYIEILVLQDEVKGLANTIYELWSNGTKRYLGNAAD